MESPSSQTGADPSSAGGDAADASSSHAGRSRVGRQNQRYGEAGARLVAGCLPIRARADGAGVEVLMVTNKHGDGMIFPKGGWENDETAEDAAARESMEEAGVRGDLSDLGEFTFRSRKGTDSDGDKLRCVARVFVMRVTEEMPRWPEQHSRHRSWCHPKVAIASCKHDWMRDAIRLWARRDGIDIDV